LIKIVIFLKHRTAKINDPKVKLVSFSVMPWIDSVSTLKRYAETNKINSDKWYLLTGDKNRIYTLGRTSYFAEKGLGLQKTNDEFFHTESMLLIDNRGNNRGIHNATKIPDVERVSDEID
jgi:protein SCO1